MPAERSPRPRYAVMYRGKTIDILGTAREALAMVRADDPNWRIIATVEDVTRIVWPPSAVVDRRIDAKSEG